MDSTERVNLRCSAIVFRGNNILLLRRDRGGEPDWVLPGGTPNRDESIVSCARREVLEETGLHVNADRIAFVLEASNADAGDHRIDIVLTAAETDPRAEPQQREPDLTPEFHPIDSLASLRLRPPIAGHLRGLHAWGGRGGAAYLGNMWRAGDGMDDTAEPVAGG
jgi:ADP-ribose pyrophosphatase YjhB (NUDIX family)